MSAPNVLLAARMIVCALVNSKVPRETDCELHVPDWPRSD
jgi:hypothetical protein